MNEPDPAGERIMQVDRVGTAIFVLAATAGVVSDGIPALLSAGVSLSLFAIGCVSFVAGYLTGLGRSRTESVDLAGLFFLVGSAPAPVRRELRGLLLAQVVVSFTAAGLRPFTESAFAILAPMFGLGMLAIWGGRHGSFSPRPVER